MKPEPRIGRKERDTTLNILTQAYVEERIPTREEYDERVEKALSATTQTQLDTLTVDLTPAIVKKDAQLDTLAHDNSDCYCGGRVDNFNKTDYWGLFFFALLWVVGCGAYMLFLWYFV